MHLDEVRSDVQYPPIQPPFDPCVALAALDELTPEIEAEALAQNLEASIRVFTRQHFFSWTQGLLQNLIRHEMLVCSARAGEGEACDVEGFSTSAVEPEPFGALYRKDAAFSAKMVAAWIAHRYQPFVLDLAADAHDVLGLSDSTQAVDGALSGAMSGELMRIDATTVLAHGTHDGKGRMASFFVFACRPEDVDPRQLQRVEMLVPTLHAAWLRTRINLVGQKSGSVENVVGRDILTAREHEVLRWVYLGKSNHEIGMILGISPLTVKNHVQEILRRLDVQNRAQAVGKAFKLHILSC
jgi:transcriptional regulator EpsA